MINPIHSFPESGLPIFTEETEWPHRMDHAGIRYALEPGLVADAIKLLGVERLGKIHQLQLLTALHVEADTPYISPPHTFPHDRLEHSIGVAVLSSLICHQLDIAGADARLAVLAGVLHDGTTSAGGDSFKLIDPELFDEDRSVRDLFRQNPDGWKTIQTRYGLPDSTPDDIAAIVQGKSILGDILNIADTSCYLAFDTRELAAACARMPQSAIPEAYHEIFSLAAQKACHIWRDVEMRDGHVIITDPARLARFLTLRILLWKNVYQHPASKILECFLVEIVYPELFRLKKIARSILVKWINEELHACIHTFTGIKNCASSVNLLGAPPRRETFRSWEDANAREDALAAAGEFTLMYDTRTLQPTKTKTDKYFVRDQKGKVATFAEAHPTEAEVIRRHAASVFTDTPVQVVHFPKSPGRKVGKRLQKAWRSARARWKVRTG